MPGRCSRPAIFTERDEQRLAGTSTSRRPVAITANSDVRRLLPRAERALRRRPSSTSQARASTARRCTCCANGVSGGNGVYRYGATSAFPTELVPGHQLLGRRHRRDADPACRRRWSASPAGERCARMRIPTARSPRPSASRSIRRRDLRELRAARLRRSDRPGGGRLRRRDAHGHARHGSASASARPTPRRFAAGRRACWTSPDSRSRATSPGPSPRPPSRRAARSGPTSTCPANPSDENDSSAVELGVKFRSDVERLHHRRALLQGRRQHRHARRQPVDRRRDAARARPPSPARPATGWQQVDFADAGRDQPPTSCTWRRTSRRTATTPPTPATSPPRESTIRRCTCSTTE